MAMAENALSLSGRAGVLLLLTGLLAGCSTGGIGSLVAPAPLETYDLSTPKVDNISSRGRGVVVIVESSAARTLDTDRILVKPNAVEINYLAGAQWSDRLPRLVQSRLLATFEKARALRNVTRPEEGIDASARLLTEIRSFELSLAGAPKVQVEITARLVGTRSGRVIAAEVFSAETPVASSEPGTVVKGLDKAMSDVLLRLVAWAGQHS